MATRNKKSTTTSNTLEQRAMLVQLTISAWSAGKYDRRVTQEVAEAHNTDSRSGHYYKRLLGREALSKINRVYDNAYNEHIFLTLPWQNNGARILSSANYLVYMEKMRAFESAFYEAVNEFLANYDDYVEVARERLNGLFNESDYPSSTELRAKFGFSVLVSPLPTAGDFRVALSDEEAALVRRQIESTANENVQRAMDEVINRLTSTVGHLAERLRAYNGSREGAFRDSAVENLRELVSVLPSLNITNDTRLDEVIRQVHSEVCLHDASTLRSDEVARTTTADAADAILERLKSFAL